MAAKGMVKTTGEKSTQWDNLMPLLTAMLKDFQDATKKKPDAAISKKKVEIVNRLLEPIFAILDGEPTRKYLDLLDEDDLPQNSDVALILGQVFAAMEAFRGRYHGYDGSTHRWFV